MMNQLLTLWRILSYGLGRRRRVTTASLRIFLNKRLTRRAVAVTVGAFPDTGTRGEH
jgi:hypothetical protein